MTRTVTIEADGRSATVDATTFSAIAKSEPPFPGFTGFAPADSLEHVAHQLMEEHPAHFGRLSDVETRYAFRFGKRPDDLAERIPEMGKAVILPPLVVDLLGVALVVWIDRWAWDELEPRALVASGPDGYWLPATIDEAEANVERRHARALHQLETLQGERTLIRRLRDAQAEAPLVLFEEAVVAA